MAALRRRRAQPHGGVEIKALTRSNYRRAGLDSGKSVEVRDDIVDMHHIGIFVMQVKQIDLVRDHQAIEHAFLSNGHMETKRPTLDHARAYTAAGALAAHNQAVDALLLQQHLQRRVAEGTGALLVDDALSGLGG